jgi:hypothetical protein
MRVPADLVQRYGRQFVRISLKTSNGLEAVKKTEVLAKKYVAQFQALQENQRLRQLKSRRPHGSLLRDGDPWPTSLNM